MQPTGKTVLKPYDLESWLCCQQELQICQKWSVLGILPGRSFSLAEYIHPDLHAELAPCLQAAFVTTQMLCLLMPDLPKGGPTTPFTTVLFSPLHSCVPMVMGAGDSTDVAWLGRHKMLPYNPRGPWKECCGFAPQSLWGISTAAAPSAKMWRDIGCCSAHCSTACLKTWIFKSYKSYCDMV